MNHESRMQLGRFGDFAAPEAPRADADPLGGPVDECSNRLQVRLEPARPDVMGVRDGAAHNRTFPADFATLCHDVPLIR